jgi:hypothetical protein
MIIPIVVQHIFLFLYCSSDTCHNFFSEGCTCDICDYPSLLSMWLISHVDYSSATPTAPSVRPVSSADFISVATLKYFRTAITKI